MTAADILEAVECGCENVRQLAVYFNVEPTDRGLVHGLKRLQIEGLIQVAAGEVFVGERV